MPEGTIQERPPKPDPFGNLDEIHKLVEEYKATIAQLRSEKANLEEAIRTHHNQIFKEAKV